MPDSDAPPPATPVIPTIAVSLVDDSYLLSSVGLNTAVARSCPALIDIFEIAA